MLTKILIMIIIFQSFFVVISKNSVMSIIYLIGIYLLTSVCFLILGAEFLSILLVIVYVGAVSILFIFVVMMLNLRVLEVYHTIVTYLPIGIFFGFFFLLEIFYIIKNDFNLFISYNYDYL